MSMLSATAYRKPVEKPPIPTQLNPLYGISRVSPSDYGNQGIMEVALSVEHYDAVNSPSFYVPQPEPDAYLYYAVPIEYGTATFKDPYGFTGGWDGASWELDDVGSEYGPVEITFRGTQWRLYRTDFSGMDGGNYRVSFENG